MTPAKKEKSIPMDLARKWAPVMAAATAIIVSSCTNMRPQFSSTGDTALLKTELARGAHETDKGSVESKHSQNTQIKPKDSQIQPDQSPHAVTSVTEAQRDFGEALLLKMAGSTADYDAAQTSAHKAFKGQNDYTYDLSGRTLTYSEWNILGEQRFLKTLRLARTNLTDERLSRLKNLHYLKELDISKTRVTDKGISVLKSFPELEKLALEGIYLSDSSSQVLSTLTNLKDLDISDTGMTDKGISGLTALTQLKRLRIVHSNLSNSACRTIAAMTQLQKLDLYRTKVDDRLAIFAPLTHLTDLRLKETSITDAGLDTVAHFPLLEDLDLNGNPRVHDEGVQKLRGLKHLLWIGLGGTSITDKSLDVVANFSTLVDLGARNSAIDDGNLLALTALKNLRFVHLEGSRVTSKGRKDLQERMPHVRLFY